MKILVSQIETSKMLMIESIETYKDINIIQAIIFINTKVGNQNKFSFQSVALRDIAKEIKGINPNKSTTKDNIPAKMLKTNSEARANILRKLSNES